MKLIFSFLTFYIIPIVLFYYYLGEQQMCLFSLKQGKMFRSQVSIDWPNDVSFVRILVCLLWVNYAGLSLCIELCKIYLKFISKSEGQIVFELKETRNIWNSKKRNEYAKACTQRNSSEWLELPIISRCPKPHFFLWIMTLF